MGRVDRVALVEDALVATMQHWPMPLTDSIVRNLGMQPCILTGKVTRAERALLAARWPGVLWTWWSGTATTSSPEEVTTSCSSQGPSWARPLGDDPAAVPR